MPVVVSDISQVFRPLVSGWRPSAPTLLFQSTDGFRSTLLAVPLAPSGATGQGQGIVEFVGGGSVRADGGALVVLVGTVDGQRFAILDLRSGTASWIGPPEKTLLYSGPVLSQDGGSIFYAAYARPTGAPTDFTATLVRASVDGRSKVEIGTLERFGALVRLTSDGAGLIWSRGQAGGSAEIFDLASGVSRHLADVATVSAMRSRQPRAILSVGGCCAGRPGGALELWDDVALTSRTIGERAGGVAWGGAVWDPSGARVAASRYDATHQYDPSVVMLDPDTGAVTSVAGADVGHVLLWPAEGLVFLVWPAQLTSAPRTTPELKLLPASGGAAVSLHKGGANIHDVLVVRP